MFSNARKRYALAILTLVYTLNLLDLGLIGLLLQPIKQDLNLSDTQLGFLTGIAFGLFYATLGLPIARWADRGNRSTITSIAIGLWGLTVMSCLLVTNFAQLVCARIAAAVGESGCMPPTYSLVGDYFPGSAERTRAMAIYWVGSPVASLVSFILGGWLNDHYGWRMTFFILGVPALVVAILVKLTVVDPRERTAAKGDAGEELPRMREVIASLWNQRASRHLNIGLILLYTMGLGMAPWYAAFMVRTHGMSTSELGLWMGLIFGLSGIAGMLLGGYVSSRWLADDERAQIRSSALLVALLVPCFALFLLLKGKYQALVALVPLMVAFSFIFGPTFALLQRLVPDRMRATALAVVMLLANLIGMGLGPQIVGALSDVLSPSHGADSLRYAMLMLSAVALWSAFHFWRAGDTIADDLVALNAGDRIVPKEPFRADASPRSSCQ